MSDRPVHENDIAIVGMAARLPGARDVDEYWRNLRDGVESIRKLTEDELIAAGESRDRIRQSNYVPSCAPLDGMELFDGEFFGFGPKESAILDPQHRHFLEVSWEALEDAGHPPEKLDGRIGVFAGCGMGSYFYFNLCTNPELVDSVGMFLLRHTGNDKDFLATRLSYLLNLTGPSVNIQTACSTSLVAVHYAVQSLLSRECDMALAGGVTIELPHRRGYLYHENEILSPDGHCHAFDHRSAGTVFGSGCGVVVLRRLGDALEDGDHVHAVIKATAVNNDGARKVGYLAPSVDGQAAAIVEALALADVTADEIGYIECHGTGTYLGDPIEISALTQAFRETTDKKGTCRIGSVKTNIGHLDTAAGVASLIKASLALDRGAMPPSLGFEKPNPTIDFESSPFVVNAALTPWPRGPNPRLAGVNSLGVGGTNAHVVLGEAPLRGPSAASSLPYQLLLLSARNRESLQGASERLAAHLREHPEESLADVAWTLREGRRAFGKRRVVVARDHEEAARILESGDPFRVFTHSAAEASPGVVFMFPGGGAQYAGMGRRLYETETVFRRVVDEGLAILKPKIDYDLQALMFATEGFDAANATFQKPSVQLPAILIIEVALAKLWASWGIEPAALIGHSMGENAAACVAGVMTFADAIGLVHLRGKLFDGVPAGGMLSVPLSAAELEPLLGDELDLASVNAPELTVASGPQAALDRLEAKLRARGVEAQRVAIDIAAHSRMLEGILGPFGDYLRSIELSAPKIPFVSNLTGKWITDAEATSPDYWVRHLRSTVRFADGLSTIHEGGERIYLEVGPGRALGSLARMHGAIPVDRVVSSLRHPEQDLDDGAHHLQTFGRLWACGLDVSWDVLGKEKRRRVRLPTYAFHHKPYFIEAGKSIAVETSRVERLQPLETWGYRPVWKQRLPEIEPEPKTATWLAFVDAKGIGQDLVASLRARGHTVVTVRSGDSFARRGDGDYVLSPEHGREGYDALIRDLVASGRVPERILHTWLVTEDESFRPGSSFFHRVQETGFYSLFFLAQALGDESVPRPLHLVVLSNGMQRVGDERLPYAEKATVLGPVQVIPHELDGVTCTSVDVELPRANGGLLGRIRPTHSARDELVTRLEEELVADPSNAIVAYRGDKRWVREHARRPLEASESRPRALRDRGTYLITGGFGGIGGVIAETLARSCSARLVLVGRAELPPRERWDAWVGEHGTDDPTTRRILRVRELEALGAEVLVGAADVTDVERMEHVVDQARRRFGAIHGVVHAAGTIRDDLIPMKQLSSIEEVFAPKIQGTLVLERLVGADPLDFFVVFSSTSTVTAPPGQVDYVAANAFLNAFAESGRARGRPVTALQWGVWNGVGMAAEAIAARDRAGDVLAERSATRPLFEKRVHDTSGRRLLTTTLSPETHWILDEHRTADGQALVPGTGYIELAAEALDELGERGPFEIRDLFFLRALHIADQAGPRAVRAKLVRSSEGYRLDVQSGCTFEDQPAWQLHAQATLALGAVAGSERIDLAAIEARCAERVERDPAGLRTPQEAHLLFGSRWRVLREVRWGRSEALARLSLSDVHAGDLDGYLVHPALLDIATGYAMDLIPGYAGRELWIPVSYRRVVIHAPLPKSVRSWVRPGAPPGEGFAAFDVTITDDDGNVLVEVESLLLKRLDGAPDLPAMTTPSRSEVELDGAASSEREGIEAHSPAEEQLRTTIELGIRPEEGAEAFLRVLAAAPTPQAIVTSIDLEALARETERVAARTQSSSARFSRPDLDSEYVAPRDEIERTLVGFWEELLGVQQVGVRDSFFDLGGHSLIAVRLFAKIKKAYKTELAISSLFEAPTIEGCARLIRQSTEGPGAEVGEAPHRRYTHLVAMHPGEGGPKRPFFLVAGMFGNVLNLRHLAHLIGTDRPFYGLQARGLYGDQAPHEDFEEAARDYLRELRTVQPRGPYLLGGFSGGGITAYEIAQQLRAEGEDVSLLVMLDTPLPTYPPLTFEERMEAHVRRAQSMGVGYVTEWARGKVRYEMAQLRRRMDGPVVVDRESFHNEEVEAAFYRALSRYEVRPYDGHVLLFRPKQDVAFTLRSGRSVDQQRELVFPDNGWTPHVATLDVQEVPGDHDSMVLEPNVRVLAARLRQAIESTEKQAPRGMVAEAASAVAE